MRKAPDLQQLPQLPQEIVDAALGGRLTIFVGAGTSRLVGLPSWSELAKNQLEALRARGLLNYSTVMQLSSLDAKKQLSIAIQLAMANNVSLDLTTCFKQATKESDIYEQLNSIGCSFVTTNYDEFLAPRSVGSNADDSEPVTPGRFYVKNDLLPTHLDTPGAVIHLHGAISDEATMVVTTREYLEHYDNSFVHEFLGHLFGKRVVLFLGYGLEEAEVLEHILRRGGTKKQGERRRFLLQGFFRSEELLYQSLHDYYLDSFGVHLIGFIRDHRDYRQQEEIVRDWATRITVKPPPLSADFDLMNEVLGDG